MVWLLRAPCPCPAVHRLCPPCDRSIGASICLCSSSRRNVTIALPQLAAVVPHTHWLCSWTDTDGAKLCAAPLHCEWHTRRAYIELMSRIIVYCCAITIMVCPTAHSTIACGGAARFGSCLCHSQCHREQLRVWQPCLYPAAHRLCDIAILYHL